MSLPRPPLLAASVVHFHPMAHDLPGASLLQEVIDGVGAWALGLALLAMLIGAAVWAIGSHSQNYQHAMAGRRAVIASGAAALVIGAAPAVVNFLFSAGHGVH